MRRTDASLSHLYLYSRYMVCSEQGPLFPACYGLLRQWTTPQERGRLGSTVLTGKKHYNCRRGFKGVPIGFEHISVHMTCSSIIRGSNINRLGLIKQSSFFFLSIIKDNAMDFLFVHESTVM